jgi:intracellular sulfur oxidation DsrE/DsrF family protein
MNMAKTLQIIETAYRANIEEQDDPAVWITGAIKGAGGDLTVLLGGNAVNYAVKSQNSAGLSFGERKQTQPPRPQDDLAKLAANGVEVYLVEDDALDRGIERADLIEGVKTIPRAGLPGLLGRYERIWRW